MKELRILTSVILVLFLISSIGLAEEKIMSLSQIEPEMKGKGYSVFKGVKIAEFDVEIIGITTYLGGKEIIIAKLSGIPEGMDFSLEETGVISGMSGSPVYIDNKLIGSVAFRIGSFTLQTIAGITPIESMLKMEKGVNYSSNTFSNMYQLSKIPFFVSTHPEEFEALFKKQGLNFKILPMGNTGINKDRGIDSLTELKPGSSISILFADGDIVLEGVGTVTYIDGDEIYALGHTMLNEGDVSFPFYLSKILTVIPSEKSSVKLAEGRVGKSLGTITQDRSFGIMGIIGKKAEMTPLKISLKSQANTREFNIRVAKCKHDLSFMQLIIYIACSEFFNDEFSIKDPNSDITVKAHLRTVVKGMPEVRTVRYFVLPRSLYLESLSLGLNGFLMRACAPLLESRFPVEFERVDLDIEVLEGKRIWSLDKAFLTKDGKLIEKNSPVSLSSFSLDLSSLAALPLTPPLDEALVKPGDTVELSIVLKNAGTLEEFLGKLTIPIPENIGKGNVEILINDTTSYESEDPFEKRKMSESLDYPKNLEELIAALNKNLDRNKLYIQIIFPKSTTTDKNLLELKKAEQDIQEKTASKSEQSEEFAWQNWKKIKDTDKLPLLKDEKPCKSIKQIVIPLDFEGIVRVDKKLRFRVEKPKPKPAEPVKSTKKKKKKNKKK